MNNSFARLVDGMCATLRTEVLPRLDDEFARGQVWGVINLLNTLKVRADWSAGFLLEQITAQHAALDAVARIAETLPDPSVLPAVAPSAVPRTTPIAELLARRDDGNRAIANLLAGLAEHGADVPAPLAAEIEQQLRAAMRAEVEIELKHSPLPLFAAMSSGQEN